MKTYILHVATSRNITFDTVNHDILLKKAGILWNKGSTALDLLKAYLSNRHQKGQIESFVSSEHLIKGGVPQGSIWDHCCSCCISTTYPSVKYKNSALR